MSRMRRWTVCWRRSYNELMKFRGIRLISGVWLVLAAACSEPRPDTTADAAQCGENARRVVRGFGERLRLVSQLAPAAVQEEAIVTAYQDLVTPELLERWRSRAEPAPGRAVSNPFPARIDIRAVQATADECTLSGKVVYVTSADTITPLELRPVTLTVRNRKEGWRVSAVELPAAAVADSSQADGSEAAEVVRRYYDAINRGDYAAAYHSWAEDGGASRQTEAQFTAGFAETRSVRVLASDSILLEGAAGSQYATVPVTIEAIMHDGRKQHFVGSYTLRRSLVDGATPAQRSWRINSARIRGAPAS